MIVLAGNLDAPLAIPLAVEIALPNTSEIPKNSALR